MTAGRRVDVLELAAHDRDPLDEFAQPLQAEKDEAEEDQALGGPDQQAAGIGRHLARLVGPDEERQREIDHHRHERQQEEQVAEDVDAIASALRQLVGHDVDPDVLVLLQRPRGAQHEDGAEEVPLQFQPRVRRRAEDLADDRIDGRHQHGDEDRPGGDLADALVEPVDGPGQCERCTQGRSPLFFSSLIP